MGSKIILLFLVTIVSVIVPNVLAMKPIPWIIVSTDLPSPDWLKVVSWLSANNTFTWVSYYQVDHDEISLISIIYAKELGKYFFVAYTYGDPAPIHMISQLGTQQEAEDGATYYYRFIGDDFYKADFQPSEGKQQFDAEPAFVSKLPDLASKLRTTIIAKIPGGKFNATLDKQIADTKIHHVDAHSDLYKPGEPFLTIHYQNEDPPPGGPSEAEFDITHNYP